MYVMEIGRKRNHFQVLIVMFFLAVVNHDVRCARMLSRCFAIIKFMGAFSRFQTVMKRNRTKYLRIRMHLVLSDLEGTEKP
ncbi:hypothetical protein SCHPADRAFT_689093 [Schizopora paradoxa]|uniref:Uncharacterized protein n=1 Tax=Schizopora paradoxa TaxID=27342 RepID=A0A0H2RAG5_9AGAM|nr:hypothetical protein SCHPADRAFT_689093 [Schizopora paradoxa]